MRIGVVTGTATYSLPGLENVEAQTVATADGSVEVTRGTLGDVEVVHIARHGQAHERLSSQVRHRAHVLALRRLGADAVLGTTVCGGLDPDEPLGSLIVFDDLHFPVNRLPDGSLCSLFTTPGEDGRGHWIFDRPYAEPLRRALLAAAEETGRRARDGGCYAHVDGPRFNSRSEIAQLRSAGAVAVSQTCGPETVLCGEAGLPYALLGFVTDYANGVSAEPTSADDLARLLGESREALASMIAAALPYAANAGPAAAGFVYRLG